MECAVCHKGKGPEKCEVCGFSDNGVIYRTFLIREDAINWLDTVVKPYRAQWEKNELLPQLKAAKKLETDLLAQIEALKKQEAGLLVQLEEARDTIIRLSPASNIFTDPRDGKVYKTVKIENQVWMAENLNYDAPGSKFYDNNSTNAEKYGRLYNWETAKKACPAGWHLPSNYEWQPLVDFVGREKIAGKKLKARSGWNDNGNGEDTYEFSALPGGYGLSCGSFYDVGDHGFWWSSSEYDSNDAYRRHMSYSHEKVDNGNYDKSRLFSVRCVQD